MTKKKPAILLILDGWGTSDGTEGNAIRQAKLPVWTRLLSEYPMTRADASGLAVGLPAGIMGNSEVGHLNLGSGRVLLQEMTLIDRSIARGEFFRNEVLLGAVHHAREGGGALHLMGLVSDGGVHSMDRHYNALIDLAAQEGLPGDRLFVHAFTDGRDTAPTSGLGYLRALEAKMAAAGAGRLATVSGRYFGMDRDNRWDRVERFYRAWTEGIGAPATDMPAAVEQAYAAGQTDEFLDPIVRVDDAGRVLGRVKDGDAVFFFNFRADRAREISRVLTEKDFDRFPRRVLPKVHYASMTQYDEHFTFPVAFPPHHPRRIFGEILSSQGKRQLRIAETEKYAHVTYFFNGGEEEPFEGEDRILIPSPKVATYDLQPEMSAPEITRRLVDQIESGTYDAIVCNYANADMVGHTGILDAGIRAVEVVDWALGEVTKAALAQGGMVLVTSDHGNVEQMIDLTTHKPHTAHTTNLVPFLLVSDAHRGSKLREGRLCDIAPTMFQLLGVESPEEFEGRSLIV